MPLALVPYAIVTLFPGDILNTIIGPGTDGLMPGSITELWSATLQIFGDKPINSLIGIGIGSEAFGKIIADFGFNVTNSHNIFLELATEAGVFALISFILIIWVRVRHRVNYHKYLIKSDVNVISSSASCAVFVLITIGATVYIWQDFSLYYLFCYTSNIYSIDYVILHILSHKMFREQKATYYTYDSYNYQTYI